MPEALDSPTVKDESIYLCQMYRNLRNPVHGVQMPPMTHNTKVILPYEKEEQEKLVAAVTEQKGNKLRFRYGWVLFLFWRPGSELAKLWHCSGMILMKKNGR